MFVCINMQSEQTVDILVFYEIQYTGEHKVSTRVHSVVNLIREKMDNIPTRNNNYILIGCLIGCLLNSIIILQLNPNLGGSRQGKPVGLL